MLIEKKKISEMERAKYNPRASLMPGDMEYENLRYSLDTFGCVSPIVWNKRTNNIVSGHQRLTVLENNGEIEVNVSVVDFDDIQEKQLNIALNKIEGDWDNEKLENIIDELGNDATLTCFSLQEIDTLKNDIDGLIDNTFIDELKEVEEIFNVSLQFDKSDKDELQSYVKEYGKDCLVNLILQKVKGKL